MKPSAAPAVGPGGLGGVGWLPWFLLGGLLLVAVQIGLVLLVAHSARRAVAQQAAQERAALIEHARRVLEPALTGSDAQLQQALLLLRDAHKLDAVHLLDAAGRVRAAPQLPPSAWGAPASLFLVDPTRLAAALASDRVQVAGVRLLEEAIERLVLPVDGPGELALCIDRRDHQAELQAAWQGPVRLGLVAAAGLALVLLGTGLWLIRFNRNAGASLQRLDSLSVVGQLAAGVAHEIRNPLGIVGSCIDLLRRRHDSDTESVELIDTVQEELRRIDEQVGLFLDLTRDQPLELQPCSLSALLHDVQQLLQHRARRAGIELEPVQVDPAVGPVLIRGDARRLRQALINHYLNAFEAQGEGQGGWVAARLDRSGDELVLRLRDGGPGFPSVILKRGGEPFLTRKPGGTGLGLSLCRRILHRHGARMELANTASGAEVRWYMPIRER